LRRNLPATRLPYLLRRDPIHYGATRLLAKVFKQISTVGAPCLRT